MLDHCLNGCYAVLSVFCSKTLGYCTLLKSLTVSKIAYFPTI